MNLHYVCRTTVGNSMRFRMWARFHCSQYPLPDGPVSHPGVVAIRHQLAAWMGSGKLGRWKAVAIGRDVDRHCPHPAVLFPDSGRTHDGTREVCAPYRPRKAIRARLVPTPRTTLVLTMYRFGENPRMRRELARTKAEDSSMETAAIKGPV